MNGFTRAYINVAIKLVFAWLLAKFAHVHPLWCAAFFFASMLIDILAMCYTIRIDQLKGKK